MSRSSSRWTIAGLMTVAGLCAVAVGVVLASVVLSPFAPASLATQPTASEVAVESRPFNDARPVQLSLDVGPARVMTAPAPGVVTAYQCAIGRPTPSGSSPISIDGAPVLALATAVPLWRDLPRGTKGADVTALQSELTRLGHPVTTDAGAVGAATLAALKSVMNKVGMTPASPSSISRQQVVWIPPGVATITQCSSSVGSEVDRGQALASYAPALLGAHITSIPTPLVPGRRSVHLGQLAVAVDDQGRVTDAADLAAIEASPAYATFDAQTAATGLPATFALDDPIPVAVVPPSAVVVDDTTSCVIAEGKPVPVEVVGSQLGESYVQFAKTPPRTVAISPPEDTTCT